MLRTWTGYTHGNRSLRGIFILQDQTKTWRDSDRQEKHSFAQECFYFQGIFSYTNEKDTSSPDCKYKHMLENEAPPEQI